LIVKVVLITSAQPSANPRLLKEVKTLYNEGFSVSVIWTPISPWADQFDQRLFNEYPTIKWIKAGYQSESQPLGYCYARIRQKLWQLIYKIIGNHFDASIKSMVLYNQELTSLALQQKADLFIGHNLGSLPAIVKAATKYNAKSIFDFEDFHRGEYKEHSEPLAKIMQVENRFIPLLSSITTASTAITQVYKNIFPNVSITTINNCFPLSHSIDYLIDLPQKPLKLFWFSQYVGKMRGLETVIESMSKFPNDEIKLTLLGTASNEIKIHFQSLLEKFNLSMNQLVFLDPVSEKDIVQIASKHHIGLASEYSHNFNRDLCLTNKIFTYLLAGNALVLSDTYAQKSFLSDNPGIGLLYKQNSVHNLTSVFKNYLVDDELLKLHRRKSLELAKIKYNWDIEQNQFLNNVKCVLTS
jgi:glycosyltransferase involved in cell wall biosynthesis